MTDNTKNFDLDTARYCFFGTRVSPETVELGLPVPSEDSDSSSSASAIGGASASSRSGFKALVLMASAFALAPLVVNALVLIMLDDDSILSFFLLLFDVSFDTQCPTNGRNVMTPFFVVVRILLCEKLSKKWGLIGRTFNDSTIPKTVYKSGGHESTSSCILYKRKLEGLLVLRVAINKLLRQNL